MEPFTAWNRSIGTSLHAMGTTLESLGVAYIVLALASLLTAAFFVAARMYLVVTPNRQASHYGLYVTMVIAALAIATTLEHRLVTWQPPTLDYAMFPHLLILAILHYWIYHDRQPWLIALGASAVLGSVVASLPVALASAPLAPVHWVAIGLLMALIGYLAFCSVSTKRGFFKARSIHVGSHETKKQTLKTQRPWLGLPQWVSLTLASLALSMLNATLQGSGLDNVPAVTVLLQTIVLLGTTLGVSAIPAGTYWLAHRHWMPELTHFVWLVWLVVGFAFSYGNFLNGIHRL